MQPLVALLISLLVSSCFQSDVPIRQPTAADYDERLLGVWHSVIDDNDVYLHIIKMPEKPWLRLIRVVHINHGGIADDLQLDMFPSMLGTDRFVNLKFRKTSQKKEDESKQTDAYWFYKYDISAKNLMTVWGVDYPAIQEAINGGKLAGKAWESTWSTNVDLNDNAEHISAFLTKPGGNQYKELGVFRRMQEAP